MADHPQDRLLSYEGKRDTYGVANFEEQASTRLDEFVVTDVGMVHLEHLTHGSAYLGIYDVDGHDMHFHLAADRNQLHVRLVWCAPTEEDTDG